MKKIISIILCLSFILALSINIDSKAADQSGRQYHVDINAEEGGNGSVYKPFRTIAEARDAIREYKRSWAKTTPLYVDVIISEGTYSFASPLTFNAEDSGVADCIINYVADGDVIFSGNSKTDSGISTVMSQSLITLSDTEYISFTGIRFENNLNAPLLNIRGDHITVDSCTFSDTGYTTIPSDKSKMYALRGEGNNITIKNCEFYNTSGGVYLSGGDRVTLKVSDNQIYNNYIHHSATSDRQGVHAVFASGVRSNISHNEIRSCGQGIRIEGNDHIVEYNTIKDTPYSIIGTGGVTCYGSLVRYNHINNASIGIELSQGTSGTTIFGNVILDAATAIRLDGGRDLSVENNVIILRDSSRSDSAVTIEYIDSLREDVMYENNGTYEKVVEEFSEINFPSNKWLNNYPSLSNLYIPKKLSDIIDFDDTSLFFNPAFSTIRRNIFYSTRDFTNIKTNITGDQVSGIPYQKRYGNISENVLMTKGDLSDFPGAVWNNFTLKASAVVFTLIPDFEDIPFNDIGRVGIKPVMKFSDVSSSDWFYTWVLYTYENGLMTGTNSDGTIFSPNGDTSRAMLVQMLYNLEDRPEVKHTDMFTDVSAESWYADAVSWAYQSGITSGTSKTTFSPDALITREQAAVMIYRFLKEYKHIIPSTGTDLSEFTDNTDISPYEGFREAVSWAVGEGIISGKSTYGVLKLAPRDTAKRSETAAIFARFHSKYVIE